MTQHSTNVPLPIAKLLSEQAYTLGYLRGALMELLHWLYVAQCPQLVEQIKQILEDTKGGSNE